MADIQSDSEFHGERFQRLDFVGKDLREKSFYECEFASCNFSESRLIGCKFDDCQFVECNLSTVRITASAFREVTFKLCKLVGIDWASAHWPTPGMALTGLVEFDECILNSSSFFGLYLQELKLEACQAHDVNFTETDCEYASFMQTDFLNSTFHHTKLSKADFTDATNYLIDIATNKIIGAKFSLPEAISLLSSLHIELVN